MTERLLVRDLIGPAVTCSPGLPLAEVARLLLAHDLEAMIVLNEDGHAVGMVSQDELVAGYGRPDRDSLTAEDVMNERIPQVRPDLPLAAAAQIMRDMGVRALFVMPQRGGITYPAGMLSYRQLLRHLAARSDDELKDLGINVVRQPTSRPPATP
ncbi:MAG: CBS domain-containing protein [Aggregatilineaceae bacterium]